MTRTHETVRRSPDSEMRAYKVLTYDLRSPIRGGAPVFDGRLLFELPRVEVDASDAECGSGWNACQEPHTALKIAGLWPDGWPSRLFVVETDEPIIERGDKVRAATWTIIEEIADVTPHIETLTRDVFRCGDLTAEMVVEQMAWREALARPLRDEQMIEAGLQLALDTRGLDWSLRRFDTARAARAAWAAWATWDARAACSLWFARAARDAWDAWTAWDAWDARAACSLWFASKRGWVTHRADLLARGLRTAYRHGLNVALPIGPDELGWAMV